MRLLPERVSVLLLTEFLLSLASFVTAQYLAFGVVGFFEGEIWGLLAAAVSVVAGGFLSGLYQNLRWKSRVALILQICGVFGIVLVIQGLLVYAQSPFQVARGVMLTGVGLNLIVMVGWRISYAALLKKIFDTQAVLFLGVDDVVCEIASNLENRPELGLTVAGFLSDAHGVGTPIAGGGCVEGGIDDLAIVTERLQVRRIVAGMEEMRRRLPVAALMAAKKKGIAVEEAGGAYETVCGRVCSRTFRPSQLVFANEMAVRPGAMALQSIYSNLAGLVAFVCAVPILAVARVAIRLTSPGSAVLSECYAGQNGIPFFASRLRCCRIDDTERVTAVGRWIRALHLEYLPRIGSVVRGEMSLVGPAPVRIEFAEHLSAMIPVYRQRLSVKPGLTGWTQIQMVETELPDIIREVETDLYYTKHLSVALDAYILLHALREVLPLTEG